MLHPNIKNVDNVMFVAGGKNVNVTLTRQSITSHIKSAYGEDATIKALCWDGSEIAAFVRVEAFDVSEWCYVTGGDRAERMLILEAMKDNEKLM